MIELLDHLIFWNDAWVLIFAMVGIVFTISVIGGLIYWGLLWVWQFRG